MSSTQTQIVKKKKIIKPAAVIVEEEDTESWHDAMQLTDLPADVNPVEIWGERAWWGLSIKGTNEHIARAQSDAVKKAAEQRAHAVMREQYRLIKIQRREERLNRNK
jgi:hypothetical protein